jgi:hypothetical protein
MTTPILPKYLLEEMDQPNFQQIPDGEIFILSEGLGFYPMNLLSKTLNGSIT